MCYAVAKFVVCVTYITGLLVLFFLVCVLTFISLLLFSVEMSGHDMVCFDKTFEAAEALLHMESPGGLHNERSTGNHTAENLVLLHSLRGTDS